MANLKSVAIFSLIALGGCGIGSNLQTTLEKPSAQIQEGEFLSGMAQSLSGGAIDLSSYRDRPLLLIFAGDTCSVCATETAKLIAHQSELTPYNLVIVTILAGSDHQTAEEWKMDHQVPWTVGFDENLELFQKYCPAGTTPCGFLQRPARGVVLTRSGPIEIDEIKTLLSN